MALIAENTFEVTASLKVSLTSGIPGETEGRRGTGNSTRNFFAYQKHECFIRNHFDKLYINFEQTRTFKN
ncbi:hypothetical protein ACJX0J_025103, partial [Zea mays]